jgi:hypothetical protein
MDLQKMIDDMAEKDAGMAMHGAFLNLRNCPEEADVTIANLKKSLALTCAAHCAMVDCLPDLEKCVAPPEPEPPTGTNVADLANETRKDLGKPKFTDVSSTVRPIEQKFPEPEEVRQEEVVEEQEYVSRKGKKG